MKPFQAALLGILCTLSTPTPARAQVTRATTKIGLPPQLTLDPPGARQPSSDPHNLNGMYEQDRSGLLKLIAAGKLGGSPSRNPGSASLGGAPPSVSLNGQPAVQATRIGATVGDAQAHCIPTAEIGSRNYPEEIFQTPGRITLVVEFNHVVRNIEMNKPFPAQIVPSYAGTSTGHWDGNTLVVETRGLKGTAYSNDPQMTAISQVTERFRKLEGGRQLDMSATIQGVIANGTPKTDHADALMIWRGTEHLLENICEDGADIFYKQ